MFSFRGCNLNKHVNFKDRFIANEKEEIKKKKEKNRKSKSRPQAGTNSSSFPSSKRHSQHLYPLSPSFPDSILSHVTKVK